MKSHIATNLRQQYFEKVPLGDDNKFAERLVMLRRLNGYLFDNVKVLFPLPPPRVF